MRDDRDAKVQEHREKFLQILEDQSAMVNGLSLAIKDAKLAFQEQIRNKPGFEIAQFEPDDYEEVAGDLIDLVTFDRLVKAMGLEADRDALFRRRLEATWVTPGAPGGASALGAAPGIDGLNTSLERLGKLLRGSANNGPRPGGGDPRRGG